jgi:hypothetical protein
MIDLAVAVIILDKPSFEPVKEVVVVKEVAKHVTTQRKIPIHAPRYFVL